MRGKAGSCPLQGHGEKCQTREHQAAVEVCSVGKPEGGAQEPMKVKTL